jgi:hypothetical protein
MMMERPTMSFSSTLTPPMFSMKYTLIVVVVVAGAGLGCTTECVDNDGCGEQCLIPVDNGGARAGASTTTPQR